MESHLREPASAPDPVSFDRINDCGDYSGIDTVSPKKDGIDVSDSYYTAPTKETYKKVNSTLTVTQNYYYFEDDALESYFNEDESFKLLHGDKEHITYWFASRNFICGITDAGWGLRVMGTRKYRKHWFI